MRFLFFLFVFIIQSNVLEAKMLQGPGVNNGGGGWICKTDAGEIKWVKFHDLWEKADNHRESGRSKLKEEKGTAVEIFERKLKWIKKNSPELQFYLDRHPIDVMKAMIFVDRPLDIIHDNSIGSKPQKNECKEGKVHYVQIANFLSNDVLLIDKNLWNSKSFSTNGKAALLLHEVIYRALREEFDESSSVRTQSIVGALFASEGVESFNETVHFYLWTEDPKPRNENSYILLFPVETQCTAEHYALGSYQSSKVSMDPSSKNKIELLGFTFVVTLDTKDDAPKEMLIHHQKSLATSRVSYSMIKAPLSQRRVATISLEVGDEIATLECRVQ